MLTLKRKLNQPTNLLIETCGGFRALGTVVVKSIEGRAVKLGFELAKDVRILREEAKHKQPGEGEAREP